MKKIVDCFMLMGTALSLRGGQKLPDMGRPLLYDDHTTIVNISIALQEFRVINSRNMEAQLTFLLNQRWLDGRLGENQNTRKMAVAGQIWRPKISIANGQQSTCEFTNENTQFWRGFGDEGNILLSEKMITKIYCTTDFRKFPFDTQNCEIKLGTYRFPMDEVELKWDSVNPVNILIGINFGEFKLVNVSTYTEIEIRESGNFTVVVSQFTISRYSLHYIIFTMVPSLILSVVCYASYLISTEKCAIRLGVQASILMLLVFTSNSVSCTMKPNFYLNALEIFVLLCVSFASTAFLETCFVYAALQLGKEIDIRPKIEKEYFKYVLIEKSYKVIHFVLFCLSIVMYCITFLF